MALLLVIAVATGAFSGGGRPGCAERVREVGRPAPEPPELPRGGRSVLPEHRVVGFYGAPQATELGALGIGTPDQAARAAASARRGRTGASGARCCPRSS